MERAIFSHALREMISLRRIWPWLILAVACFGMAIAWKRFNPESDAEQQYTAVMLIFVYRILALLSAVATTAILTQEIEQRTIVYLLTRPVPRWKLLLLRYAASVVVVFSVAFVAAALTYFGAFRAVPTGALFWRDVGAIGLGSLAYGALFMVVSLLINRAMLVCLLFAFAWETSVPNMPGELYRATVSAYVQGVAQHPDSGLNRALGALSGTLGTNVLSPTNAAAILLLATLALLVFGAYWFSKSEYVPREDVE